MGKSYNWFQTGLSNTTKEEKRMEIFTYVRDNLSRVMILIAIGWLTFLLAIFSLLFVIRAALVIPIF